MKNISAGLIARFLLPAFIVLASFLFLLMPLPRSVAQAAWSGEPYAVGETLNPECAPTDQNCTVNFAASQWANGTSTSGSSSISYGGYVGIGTTTPRTALDIVSSNDGVVPLITLQSSSSWFDQGPAIAFKDGDIGNYPNATSSQIRASSVWPGGAGLAFDVTTGTYDNSDLSTGLIVHGGSGNVGIGTINPGYKLEVSDTAAFAEINIGQDSVMPVDGQNFTLVDTNSNSWTYEFDNNGSVGENYSINLQQPNGDFSYGGADLTKSELLSEIADKINQSGKFMASVQDGYVKIFQLNQGAIGNKYNSISGQTGFSDTTHYSTGFSVTDFVGGTSGDINFTGNIYKNGSLYAGASQWTTSSSSDIYFNSGYVGIGTTTPSVALSVVGQSTFVDLRPDHPYNPNIDTVTNNGLTAQWWNSQGDFRNPDYSITPDITQAAANPSVDMYSNRPGGVNNTGVDLRAFGWIKADYSETYSFCASSDDGSKVFVNGVLVVAENWNDQSDSKACGNINLTANTWYPYIVEYYQVGGPGDLNLTWSSNSLNEQAIPLDHTTSDGALPNTYSSPSISFFTGASTTLDKYIDVKNSLGTSAFSISSSTAYFGTNVGIGTTTPSSALSIVGSGNSYTQIDGDNLVQNGSFTSTSEPWNYDGDWQPVDGAISHVFNDNPSNLVQTVTTVDQETYKVTFDLLSQSSDRIKGSVNVSLGNDYSNVIFNADNSGTETLYLKSYGGSNLIFIPSSDFNGTITNVSVYHVKKIDPILALFNTDGTRALEFRSGSSNGSSDSTLVGVDAGAFSQGFLVNAIGSYSAMYNTGALVNAMGPGAAQNNSGWFVNAIGVNSLQNNSGSNVIGLGNAALSDKQGGNNTIGIGSDDTEGTGFFTGTQKSIDSSVLIGQASVTNVESNSTSTLTNIYAIGGRATESNQFVLGNDNIAETLLHGNVGIGTSTPVARLAVEGSHAINFTKQSDFQFSGSTYSRDVVVQGDYAYTADMYSGFHILNIKDKSNPKLVATVPANYSIGRVIVSGNTAYVADGSSVRSFDISDPLNPVEKINFSPIGQQINSLAIKQNTLYIASGSGVIAYDVTEGTNFLGAIYFDQPIQNIAINGDTLLAVGRGGQGKLYTLDISNIGNGFDPKNPVLIGSYNIFNPGDVAVDNNEAYVISQDMTLTSFDVSDPTQIKKQDSVRFVDNQYNDYTRIKLVGGYAYVTDGEPDSIYAAYVADPTYMEAAGHYSTGSNSYGLDVDLDGNVYVADANNGLVVLKAEQNNDAVIAAFTKGTVSIGAAATSSAALHVAGLGGNDGLKFTSVVQSSAGNSYTPSDVSGNYLYALNSGGGFDVFDISNPNHSVQVASYNIQGNITAGPVISGNYAYVADDSNDIDTIDITNPKAPSLATTYLAGSVISHLKASGGYLYALGDDNQIKIYSINGENVLSPSLVASFASHNTTFNDFTLAGSKLFASTVGGMEVYDISNPEQVTYISTYATQNGTPNKISVVGDTVYLSESGSNNKIEIVDISNINSPTYVSQYLSQTGSIVGAVGKGHFVFGKNGYNSIEVIDVTDGSNPKFVTSFKSSTGWYDVPFISGNYLYALNDNSAIESIDITNPKAPIAAVFTGGRVGVGTDNPDAAFSVVGSGGDSISLAGSYYSTTGGLSGNPYVVGGYAYIVNQNNNVEIINVKDPTHPVLVSTYVPEWPTMSGYTPYVSGNYMYQNIGEDTLDVVDISNPAEPTHVAYVSAPGVPLRTYAVANNILYSIDQAGILQVFDVSDVHNIRSIESYTSSQPFDYDDDTPIVIDGSYLYARYQDHTVGVINISNPSSLSDASDIAPHTGSNIANYGAMGNVFYAADNANNIEFFDVTNHSAPYYLSSFVSTSATPSLDKLSAGENGYVFMSSNDCSITAINISYPNNPTEADRYTAPNNECVTSPFVADGKAYVGTVTGAVQIFDISGIAHPASAATFSNGRVGIGSNSPLAMLDVNGNAILSGLNRYLNFGLNAGTYGYGIRDNGGHIEYKDQSGNWTGFASTTSPWITSGESDISYGGSVAIGTTTVPLAKLFVDGDASAQSFAVGLSVDDKTNNSPWYGIGMSNTILPLTDYEQGYAVQVAGYYGMQFVTATGTAMVINEQGKVGIGTTTPESALEVNGDIRISTGSNGRLYFGDGSSMFTATAAGTGIESWNDLNFVTGGQFSVETGDGNSTSTKFIVKNDGSVGIGTSDPTAPLDVETADTGQKTMLALSSGFSFFDEGPKIAFRDSFTPPWIDAASIQSVAYAPGAAGLAFNVGTIGGGFGGVGTHEAMRIRVDGSVGIGTSNPDATLHISATSSDLLMLQSTVSGGGNAANLSFDTYGDIGTGVRPTAQLSAIDDGSYSSALAFSTKLPGNDTNDLMERMRISSNGMVGIGTTTPDQALSVAGSIDASNDVCASFICLNQLAQPSDSRFKTNITALESDASSTSVLSNLMKLNPVTYNWNDTYLKMNPDALDASTTKLGFIAQEVDQVFPQAVIHMPNGFLGVDYGKLTSVLTAAMQEMVRITGVFKDNLIGWMGDATNGIKSIYSNEIHTKQLCVAKADGSEVCVTGDQLQNIITSQNSNTISTGGINTEGSTGGGPILTPVVDVVSTTTSSSTPSDSNTGDSTSSSSVEYSGGTNQTTTENSTGSGNAGEGTAGTSGTAAASDTTNTPTQSGSSASDTGSSVSAPATSPAQSGTSDTSTGISVSAGTTN